MKAIWIALLLLCSAVSAQEMVRSVDRHANTPRSELVPVMIDGKQVWVSKNPVIVGRENIAKHKAWIAAGQPGLPKEVAAVQGPPIFIDDAQTRRPLVEIQQCQNDFSRIRTIPARTSNEEVVEFADEVAQIQAPIQNPAVKITKGEDGKAATVKVGSVTTGEPSVVNVGTDTDAVLNFTLPDIDYFKIQVIVDEAIAKAPKGPTLDDVKAIVDDAIAKAPKCECKEPESPKEHLVLIADQSAPYWPRLKGEYELARGNYSAFRIAPPPEFSVQLPQLVLYRGNTFTKQIIGLREVSQALSAIYRGESF